MKVAIITGGIGSEREVSLSSAKNIQKLLSIPDELVFDYPNQLDKISNSNIDICIPLIHGEGGEDGELQTILEELNIPYIFSSPTVHKKCLNKREAKQLLSKFNINSAKELSIKNDIDKPVFVKPVLGGSSVYTKKISSKSDLVNFINNHQYVDFIIEEALEGKEFSVGVIETKQGIKALPIIEIKTKGEFFDYDSKYNNEKLAQEICPADISPDLTNLLREQALIAHKEMGCKHISRSDFIVNKGNQIFFLEINTIPGMTSNSLLPKEIEVEGLSLKDLLVYWISQVK